MQSTRYSCRIVITVEFPQHIFEIYTNIKFQEIPFSGSRVVPCERTDRRTDRHADIMKLIVAFRNSANAPKNVSFVSYCSEFMQ
jgi:hypothetical protein